MAGGRKRLRNPASRNCYGITFLGQTDPSASTSSTSSSRDNVPESQIPSAAPYVPPQAYDPAAYYPQQQAQYDDPAAYYPQQQAQYDEPPQQPRSGDGPDSPVVGMDFSPQLVKGKWVAPMDKLSMRLGLYWKVDELETSSVLGSQDVGHPN
ncbi:hypothetical protein Bca52824_026858 [Brassica carinata]|uniref:Uncharacterized protein n=1 Tax=Brassica carinata TaxID=52824 RepID=A0A8X7V8B6_BRACI|nr:hypothetical protein Bca52824_026858 [Brassica carinata]